ncbi:TPA: acylphosphatase [Patescibacteria group bacterium]|uniref:Acylphosphatase n=1 Tax=Candidatus Gottesmanbacteria bacterium GW2011_GWA1_43_11 TaxID=1618436 RepID=A0A0G1FDK3_9BACT|nr:MAG: Acylphosphatase [Candidatus Gottesmanbacteria bacterium GW2011_GWA1_43_11]HCS78655.1 acylphosphatase [Patescibacteria group bacterium]
MKSVHLIISGQVQGVGFRSWMKHQADILKLTGWVKNRPDGAVEAIVSGQESSVNKLVTVCREGAPGSVVNSLTVASISNKECFSEFF